MLQVRARRTIVSWNMTVQVQPLDSSMRTQKHTPLGISPFTLGTAQHFQTRLLTLEFKNNLDGLIDDIEGESPKRFENI